MGLLDFLGSQGMSGGLLDSLFQSQGPNYANLNPDAGDTERLAKLLAPSPFASLDQPQAPKSPFDGGGSAPLMYPGISGQMAMQPGQFGQLSPMVSNSPPPMQPLPAAPPAPQAPQAPQNDPINTMNVGGYQMPQFGTAADYTPQSPQLSQSVRQARAQDTPQEPLATPAFLGGQQGAGLGDRLNAGVMNFANGPGGLVGKLASGISGLASGNRADAGGMQQQNLRAQYDATRSALIANGVPERQANSTAMLSVMNPEVAKTVLPEMLTNKEEFKTITDAFGNQVPMFVNTREQTINGRPVNQGADTGTVDSGMPGGLLAPGVKQIDSTLNGQDYLKQFAPEVQAAVQNYVDGKSMPTGNPRKGFTQTVKMIAQKYGSDIGQPTDDATYAARRTMRNQLSSSAPSSLGGHINIGNTAAGHLADLSQKAIDLGNYDTGIAPLTAAVNGIRGLGTEQAAKMEALKGAAQHYGQEITKFYAGSPGGTAERDRFIESVNGARSPKELAAILATEGELMRSRLDALGGQIKGVLGDEGAKQYPVLRSDGQAALAKVEENVSRLKGNQSASGTNTTKTGVSWSIVH